MRGERGNDRVQDIGRVPQHVIVPEPQHPEPAGFQEARACVVATPLRQMLAAIQLHDEMSFRAGEIGEVGPYPVLPPELPPQQAPVAQVLPQHPLRFGLVAP